MVQATFKNATGFEVEDTPEVLPKEFFTTMGLDFAKCLPAERERLHDMRLSQCTMPVPAPGVSRGTVRRLIKMGGHELMQIEEDCCIHQLCIPFDPVMDEDPCEDLAPNIKIGHVDPKQKQSIPQGMMVRSQAAIQEFRGNPPLQR